MVAWVWGSTSAIGSSGHTAARSAWRAAREPVPASSWSFHLAARGDHVNLRSAPPSSAPPRLICWPGGASPSTKRSLLGCTPSSPDAARLGDAHAGEDLHGIARIEVERNEELQRLAHLRFREPNRDLRGPVGNGFQAEKPPFALIDQREAKTSETASRACPLRPGP